MSGEAIETIYLIGHVARMLGVHPQTLRIYEREGLLRPRRSERNTRVYSEIDVRRAELVLTLTRDLGINLAGVEVILRMRERIERLRQGRHGNGRPGRDRPSGTIGVGTALAYGATMGGRERCRISKPSSL